MILTTLNNTVEQESVGISQTRQAGIDESSYPYLFELVSKNFYSNGIGSLIRELTSNCFDAHIESGLTKPILVNLLYDVELESYYIEFCDNGIGISPERFDTIYMNWFSSTKRGDNNAIGGFGIGSKSFFAYTEFAYIKTVHNGIKYQYILHQGIEKPELETLSINETNEESGTRVRIDIKNYEDYKRFIEEINKQLSYFDGVFINARDAYKFDNKYQILETEYFKYRTSNRYSDELHVVIDQVAYPIDWKIINQYKINLPLGVKFNIGELDITPNREQLRYTDRTIKLLLERIQLVREEVQTIYDKQNSGYTELDTFFKVRFNGRSIKLGDHKVNIGGVNSNIYTLFPSLVIGYNPLFDYIAVIIKNGKESKKSHNINEKNISNYYLSKKLDKFNNLYLEDGVVLMPKYVDYKTYCNKLGIKRGRKTELGKAKLIYAWKQHVKEYLKNTCKRYNTVTQQWIANYKELNKKKREVTDKTVVECQDVFGYRYKTTVEELSKFLIVFYAPRKEWVFGETYLYPNWLKKWGGEKKVTFIVINQANEKKIRQLENLRLIDTFFETPELQNYFDKVRIAYEISMLSFHSIKVSKYYANIREKVITHREDYKIDYYIDFFIKQLTNVKESSSNYKLREQVKELKFFYQKAEILDYIDLSIPNKYLKQIVKTIKITKLNYIP